MNNIRSGVGSYRMEQKFIYGFNFFLSFSFFFFWILTIFKMACHGILVFDNVVVVHSPFPVTRAVPQAYCKGPSRMVLYEHSTPHSDKLIMFFIFFNKRRILCPFGEKRLDWVGCCVPLTRRLFSMRNDKPYFTQYVRNLINLSFFSSIGSKIELTFEAPWSMYLSRNFHEAYWYDYEILIEISGKLSA